MKTIEEMRKKGFVLMYKEKLREAFTLDWYFKGYEKLIILGCFLWTVYSIFKFVKGLI
ncbi:unnamed protein product [marine sediment metagenome]|uniref:Uncharacterized protein n=1 Tax=marine sediment metagenome TaxID=412755 RepID=X1HFM6_9ZZZZ